MIGCSCAALAVRKVLAYVFVHRPSEGADWRNYASRLLAFHAALAAAPPRGFRGSWVWQVEAGPLGAALEDWYLVEDWAALGTLNRAAVTGPRRAPHDDLVPRAAQGVGAVYGLVFGRPGATPRCRVRLAKPLGVPYPDFEAGLQDAAGPDAVIWKRQMVLGPDLEFLIDVPQRAVHDTTFGQLVDVSPLRPL